MSRYIQRRISIATVCVLAAGAMGTAVAQTATAAPRAMMMSVTQGTIPSARVGISVTRKGSRSARHRVPRASVAELCLRSDRQPDREIVAIAVMRNVRHTRRQAVMFTLQIAYGGRYFTLPVPHLRVWHYPAAKLEGHLSRWTVDQAVGGLAAGSIYRMKVGFRWYGAGTKLLKHETLYSRACRQPASAG